MFFNPLNTSSHNQQTSKWNQRERLLFRSHPPSTGEGHERVCQTSQWLWTALRCVISGVSSDEIPLVTWPWGLERRECGHSRVVTAQFRSWSCPEEGFRWRFCLPIYVTDDIVGSEGHRSQIRKKEDMQDRRIWHFVTAPCLLHSELWPTCSAPLLTPGDWREGHQVPSWRCRKSALTSRYLVNGSYNPYIIYKYRLISSHKKGEIHQLTN